MTPSRLGWGPTYARFAYFKGISLENKAKNQDLPGKSVFLIEKMEKNEEKVDKNVSSRSKKQTFVRSLRPKNETF